MSRGSTRTIWVYPLLLLALACLFVISVLIGSVDIAMGDVWRVLVDPDSADPIARNILVSFRIPGSITAMLAGAALAVSGLQMQALFRNPLAGPFVLGVNAGAGLGVAVVVLGVASGVVSAGLIFGGDGRGLGTVGAAIIGAGLVMSLVLLVSQRIRDHVSILILGLMFGYGASAIVSVLVYVSEAENIQSYLLWSMGSFGGLDQDQVRTLGRLIVIGLVLAGVCVKPMNALLLGEDYARSMGVRLERVRALIIVSTALLAGSVTAYCGPVAFLGLAVPHLCRGVLMTADQRVLFPAVMLMGASLALVSDAIARVPGSDETLPLNAVTAFVGAPVVVWVILRRRRMRGVT